jgi:NADPH:quinone reductase-like Zn-dependent oxidoreductase
MKLRYKILGGIGLFFTIALSSLALTLGYTSDCAAPTEISSESPLMKAIVYRCYGSPDVLELADVEKPVPADDELLVKVHAASVNPLDWHYMRGAPYVIRLMSGLGAPDDSRMGVDFSGTVEAVGSEVTLFKPGDEVFGAANGAFADYATIRENRAVALKPENISFEQAATVPIAAISALQALRDKGRLKPGQEVLINGASGGVGTFAVQIAKSMGAEVTGVCSTRNVEMVRSIGADHVFDYTREDYTESGKQYDLIIDNVSNHSLLANRRALKPEGILVLVGGTTGNWLGPFASPVQAMLLTPLVGQEFSTMLGRLSGGDLAILAELMQKGEVTPVIDRRYALNEVAEAVRYSEEGHARGKIVIAME